MLYGRDAEKVILDDLYNSNKSEFVAVYGRRRVGKTFLIREHFGDRMVFDHSGVNSSSKEDQFKAFENTIKDYGVDVNCNYSDWFDAFQDLKKVIMKSDKKKKVVFLDEISWMDTLKSNFIVALESFWNGWCVKRKDILLIVCGSVASYMQNKIIHNIGGLYNRLSRELLIKPFTLKEVEEFLIAKGFSISRKSIVELYMCLGGVPYYYEFVKKDLSVPQMIDELFFKANAPLKNEYNYLFRSQFVNFQQYVDIVDVLSQRKNGYTRDEIISHLKASSGGVVSERLEVLIQCGYVRKYKKFGNKEKDSIYQLIDNFVLFHNKFLNGQTNDENFWSKNQISPTILSWQGLSFEIVVLEHTNAIKEKLGISGVYTNNYSFSYKGNSEVSGFQIDLILDRADNIVNICEIKFSDDEYKLEKDQMVNLLKKVNGFKEIVKTKKSINLVFVTTYGLARNMYSDKISTVLTLEDLFK